MVRDRRDAAQAAAFKVSLLGAPVPVAQTLIQSVVIPKFLYGIFMQPPPKRVTQGLKAHIQRAEGLTGCAHSWEVINAIVV